MNTLNSGSFDWLLDSDIEIKDLIGYQYPTLEEFEKANLQIVYLGWFLGDWSLVNNAEYSCASGLLIRDDLPENTGDLYGLTALDEDWVTLNQMIKYYKFGFGRATDYVNEEIRIGRIDRNLGIKIVEKYDGCCSNAYISSFCEYLEISETEFWEQVYANVNKDLFTINDSGEIKAKFKVGENT